MTKLAIKTERASIMKEIIDDYREEGYTKADWLRYGVVYPIILIAACVVAELMNSL